MNLLMSMAKWDLPRLYFKVSWTGDDGSQSVQFIEYPEPGLTFLLGKNGAGKSTLLNGLRDFATGRIGQRCSISLICGSRSAADPVEWENTRREMMSELKSQSVDFWLDIHGQLPPMLMGFKQRTVTGVARTVGGPFRGLSGREILLALGWSGDDVWADAPAVDKSITKVTSLRYLDEERTDIPEHLEIPQHPGWLMLDMMTACEFEPVRRPEIDYVNHFTSPDEWLSSNERLSQLRAAVEEFSNDASVEFAVRGASWFEDGQQKAEAKWFFRYVSPLVPGGSLSKLLDDLADEARDFPQMQKSPDEYVSLTWPLFPHGLFEYEETPSGPGAAGPWLEWTRGCPIRLSELFSTDHSVEVVHALQEEIFGLLIDQSDVEWTENGDKLVVEFGGFDALRTKLSGFSGFLQQLDAGIGGLDLSVEQNFVLGLGGGLKVPGRISIVWHDTRSGTWRQLDSASDGQLRILSVVLTLVKSMSFDNVMMLGDEFDRTLHPTLARDLASQLNGWLVDAGGIGLMSTHNVGLVSVSRNKPWEMTRSLDGTFAFMEWSDSVAKSRDLGVSEIELLRMSKLVILVEGYHDELVIGTLLNSNDVVRRHVRIVQANGIKNLRNLWDVYLGLLDCPILVVHDKRLPEFEDAILRAKLMDKKSDVWTESGFAELRTATRSRGHSRTRTELRSLLDLVETVIENGAIERLVVRGLDVDDIVDCLPFDAPFRRAGSTSWEEAHERFRNEGRTDGSEFKQRHNINNDSVNEALGADDSVHPELSGLFAFVLELIGEVPPPGM